MVFNVTIYRECADSGTVYTENGLHRPYQITNLTGTALNNILDVHPRMAEKYRRMVVPYPWKPSGFAPWRFLKVDEHYYDESGNRLSATIYGWVDSVRMITEPDSNNYSDTVPDGVNLNSAEINWHIDWWLTRQQYGGSAPKFKGGRLKRGPSSYARPDPSTPRLWKYSSTVFDVTEDPNLVVGQNNWILVQHTVQGNNNTTEIVETMFPCSGATISGHSPFPNLMDVYEGRLEETIGIDPDDIIGAWVSPIGNSTLSNLVDNGTYSYFRSTPATNIRKTLSTGAQTGTTDNKKTVITDPYGNIAGTLPWGLSYSEVVLEVDIGASGGFANFYFKETGGTRAEGRVISVPLIQIPVTSNAYSSYYYSGQRDYDIETKRIQNEQALVSGIANAGTSAIGGAIAGGNAGPVGAAAGAGAGFASAIIGSGVNYLMTGMYDSQQQAAVDRLMSNQSSNLVMGGGGLAWLNMDVRWKIVEMTRDSVSLAELTAEQSELGYLTDTQVADCTSLIAAKGPLRIEGLEVYNVPPEAAAYISQMFARGVHLD